MEALQNPYESCLCLASRRLARVLTQAYDHALADEGLKITQFSVMCALGSRENGAVPLSSVADALDLEPSSLTRALGPLVRDGFVQITQGKDKRQRFGALTEHGKQKLKAARVRWADAQKKTIAAIGAPDAEDMIRRLNNARRLVLAQDHTFATVSNNEVQ